MSIWLWGWNFYWLMTGFVGYANISFANREKINAKIISMRLAGYSARYIYTVLLAASIFAGFVWPIELIATIRRYLK